MCGDQVPGGIQEGASFRGQPDQPRRSLYQATTEAVFQTFDLQAYRRLRAVHRLRRTREAVEIGYQDERLNGFDVERLHGESFKYEIIEI
jgi:hypothetical protein